MAELHVVTGAFGYSGRRIARRLLAAGHTVRTLTTRAAPADMVAAKVEVRPFDFDRPEELERSLAGAAVLYNTYWVRFNAAGFSQSVAVENTLRMFAAAKRAGVGRIVHVSITNPSADSHLEYFRDKAALESALVGSGLSYAILRPAVLFGDGDILINNIAWTLRHLPIFGVFGDGAYRIRPIHVEDLAALAMEQGRARGNETVDAVGPESFSFRELAREIGEAIGHRRPIVSVPPIVGFAVAWLIGKAMGDVMLTRQEVAGLMAGLLDTNGPATGTTKLSAWLRENAEEVGRRYASELGRRR